VIFAAATLAACTSSFEGEYSDPNKAEIVDDKWNETDSRKTAEEMIKRALEKSWLTDHMAASKGKKPVVIVDDMKNRTDEHIDTKALTDNVQNALINSNKVRFVAADMRAKIIKEMEYQNDSKQVADDSKKTRGKQIGADFFLTGSIAAFVASQGGLKTVTYQTVMQMVNLETSEIVWSDKYEIKKRFKRSGTGW
jgi:uncharacterized protein (TIGR02722 family)